ncbi:hypothetical protein, partial [Klebsiella pneumoniae]|uniref:hypothetical protein n=1 Tax=Klebsiella pneumoniae TaxID=573 RepID=UPI003EE31744
SNYRQDYDPDCEDEETRRQFSAYVYNTSTCQDLTATDRQQEMDDFVTRHKKYIDKLKEVYGENEVVLCWGFLTWAS